LFFRFRILVQNQIYLAHGEIGLLVTAAPPQFLRCVLNSGAGKSILCDRISSLRFTVAHDALPASSIFGSISSIGDVAGERDDCIDPPGQSPSLLRHWFPTDHTLVLQVQLPAAPPGRRSDRFQDECPGEDH
jgi:hypothetical protein